MRGRIQTWRRMLWLTVAVVGVAALQGPVAAALGVRGGQGSRGTWLEVPAGEYFDLVPDPAQPGFSRLLFQGWSPGPGGTGPVDGLVGARVEEAADGGGAYVVVPFAVGQLRAVQRMVDGWRFVFVSAPQGSAAPETGEYRLGTRDVIEIAVHGHEDLARTDTVPPDGVLSFPLIGEVRLAGRTIAEVEGEIQRRLEADFLVDPKVTVRVSAYESQWVNIVGFVRKPGKYPIKGRTTLVDIITQAGGLADKAGSRIILTRAGADGSTERREISREDLFSADNAGADHALRHGDIVNVLEQPTFYIQGEVARPGSYPLERGYTVLKAISVAGGMSQWADRKSVELHREAGGEAKKIVINLKAIEQRKQPDMEVLPEDIIIVKRRLL